MQIVYFLHTRYLSGFDLNDLTGKKILLKLEFLSFLLSEGKIECARVASPP